MKLRNKKTGEIGYLLAGKGCNHYVVTNDNWEDCGKYRTLIELNEEWEDYEEPKTFWYIRCSGEVYEDESDASTEHGEKHKEIGNYFETKEEAEKAVEKLKAWKRLKDKGFRFKCCDDYHIDYELTGKCAWTDKTEADLDLLFGGEE